MFFQNRAEAGKLLAKALEKYQGQDVVVYALPRGGVVTALEIAKYLKAPLDLIIARKIGHPAQPEYAIAATTETGEMVGNPEELKSIDHHWLTEEIEKQRLEAKRRRETYLQDKKTLPVEGKIAIIVDDGIATGLTMRAGVAELQKRHPQKIVVAIPVTPRSTAELLQKDHELVALDIPDDDDYLGSVGSYYADFPQVEDQEVITMLKENNDPLLFTFMELNYMLDDLQKVPNLTPGKFVAKRFPNEELHIKLETKIKNKPCLILGSIVPPEANLFSFLLLAHTLKKENAQQIITLLPYLAYSRHDKQEPQKSYATALIGNLLQTSGIAEVITVDVHNPQTKRLFPIPLISLSPAQIFAEKIKKLQLQNVTLVAPDEGAILRTQAVAKKLNYQDKITFMIKTRTETGLTHSEIHGKISKQVIIIDDMLDTGTTLISCCKKLKENGAEEIYIIVTHGLFTGDNWQKLWSLGVKHIYCTDTLPLPDKAKDKNISVLSVMPLITNYLQAKQWKS